jgi:DNA-binding CsgD family transcriptional regulator
VEAARLGSESRDEELLGLAERSAVEAKAIAGLLPGHAQWLPECDAALASVFRARGDMEASVASALAAVQTLAADAHEDVYPDVLLPTGEVLLSAGPAEAQDFVRSYLQVALSRIVQGTMDEAIRVRWLKGPIGSRLVELAGEPATGAAAGAAPVKLEGEDRELMLLMTEGLTNREMAERLNTSEESISSRLARVLATLGASDRAQATTLAMRGLGASLPVGSAGQGLASA